MRCAFEGGCSGPEHVSWRSIDDRTRCVKEGKIGMYVRAQVQTRTWTRMYVCTHALKFLAGTTQREKHPGASSVSPVSPVSPVLSELSISSAHAQQGQEGQRGRERDTGGRGRKGGGAADHERGCARERECYLTCVTVARDAASRPRMEERQASAVCMDVPAHGRGRVGAPVAFVAEIWRACWRWIEVWSFLEFGGWEPGR